MKIKLWVSITIVILVILAFLWIILPAKSDQKKDGDEANINYDKLDEVVFDVRAKPVVIGDLILYINANGIVRATEELELTSNISGIINTLNIFEGKDVNKGDLLIGLDDREYELALNDTRVKVTDSRVEYGFLEREAPTDTTNNSKVREIMEQIKKLDKDYKDGKIDELKYNASKDDLDMKLIFSGAKREEVIQNKSGLTTAINAYKRAKLNYEYTKILAPFNGVVGDFDLVNGQRINAGQKLCKLFNTSTLRVDVGVLENDVTKIKVGNIAKVEVPSVTGEAFSGRVLNVSPYIDKETKTCKVTIQIQNSSNKLKPGMFVKVFIESNNLQNRILIPKEALLVRDKRPLVFVVEGDLAKWKYVQIGEQNDEFIEVKEGVDKGENVIVEGQYTLAHDAKVRVIK
ncbi:MAG: efflux RND transporter periplasmic adaptor subunit [Ignavibacteriales bacterium]|nr:efflux RND transporter periplasmic adaptor subunit [Ignavibacteriales bacterium]